jgi:hypothetical protein
LASASRINSDAGSISFTNATKALELSTYALNIGGAGDVTISVDTPNIINNAMAMAIVLG